jgi:hypothetical protein
MKLDIIETCRCPAGANLVTSVTPRILSGLIVKQFIQRICIIKIKYLRLRITHTWFIILHTYNIKPVYSQRANPRYRYQRFHRAKPTDYKIKRKTYYDWLAMSSWLIAAILHKTKGIIIFFFAITYVINYYTYETFKPNINKYTDAPERMFHGYWTCDL